VENPYLGNAQQWLCWRWLGKRELPLKLQIYTPRHRHPQCTVWSNLPSLGIQVDQPMEQISQKIFTVWTKSIMKIQYQLSKQQNLCYTNSIMWITFFYLDLPVTLLTVHKANRCRPCHKLKILLQSLMHLAKNDVWHVTAVSHIAPCAHVEWKIQRLFHRRARSFLFPSAARVTLRAHRKMMNYWCGEKLICCSPLSLDDIHTAAGTEIQMIRV